MNKLKEVIAYLTKYYPCRSDLSNARITKIIYLSDWHHAINYDSQITNIQWYFDNYGPFVKDVFEEVVRHADLFEIKMVTNMYGNEKTIFVLKQENYVPNLSDTDRQSIDHIINISEKLSWNDFIRLVYSTYPITSSERYSHLNLITKALEYKTLR